MDNLKIKQIELLGEKIGLKEKPVVTNKNILFVAGFFGLSGFKTHISEWLIKEDIFFVALHCVRVKKET